MPMRSSDGGDAFGWFDRRMGLGKIRTSAWYGKAGLVRPIGYPVNRSLWQNVRRHSQSAVA
jgi:hypothetical protein